MKKTTVSLFALTLFLTLFLALGATAGVYEIEPEGPLPVVKQDGARVYMGGWMNGMSVYFAQYMTAWIKSSSEVKHFKLFQSFSGSHSYGNADGLPTTLANVKPDVVIMTLGVDALYYGMQEPRLSAFKANWKRMADACEKAGVKQVFFSAPAKYGSKPEEDGNRKLAAYADELKAFAKSRGHCYFDLHRVSYGFKAKHDVANIDDLDFARFMLDLFGIKVVNPHMTADFAAGTASIDAPNTIVAKGKGAYELTCPRPPLGFTYCGAEAAKWTGLEIKVANLPADCDEVKIGWPGTSRMVKRTDLEKGLNLEAVAPGWTPFRDAGLTALGGGKANPGWQSMVLTSRLPSFKNAVTKMENGRDRTAFFDMLQKEIYEGVDREFDRAEEATAAWARGPVKFTLTFTPVKKK